VNAWLIDMARRVLQRHAEKIPDAADLTGLADELEQRYSGAPPGAPLAAADGRQSGGRAIRARAAAPGGASPPAAATGNPAGPGGAA
jgi:hypothetical protein